MLEKLNDLLLAIGDPALGWLLRLNRDLALAIVAALTGLVMILIRRWTTDQRFLRQCEADKARLNALLREAKRRKDAEAKARIQRTVGMLGLRTFRAEGRPLLFSIVPIALIATWAFGRLAYLPPRPGEAVRINAYTPSTRIGERIHLTPAPGLAADHGWLQRIRAVTTNDFAWGVYQGMASWDVRAEPRAEPYRLRIRFAGETFEMPLLAGQPRYSPPIVAFDHPGLQALTADLAEYRPFGIVPGLPALMLQPWLVGYLILVIPMSLLLKRVLRVA